MKPRLWLRADGKWMRFWHRVDFGTVILNWDPYGEPFTYHDYKDLWVGPYDTARLAFEAIA